MSNFLLGVLASLSAMFIGFLIVQVKTRALLSWGTFFLFWSITRRLRDTGITNFFTSRSDYVSFRKERSISEYISTTKKEFLYVGFWLAQGVEIDNVYSKFRELLHKGCTVEIVLMDQNSDSNFKRKVAAYLGFSEESLSTRLSNTWSNMIQFKNSLSEDLKARFILRYHQELVSSSTFIFDYRTESAKTLVDFKLYGMGREQSFGIELKPSEIENSLYERVTNSFLEIKKKATVVI